MVDRLEAELAAAVAELRAHRASMSYAFAMGSDRHGGSAHPAHRQARARAEQLASRCADLRAQLAEHRP